MATQVINLILNASGNEKMILHNKQQINFILKILFLLVTFIFLIKEESETNKFVDYSNYSEKTYPEFVVDLDDIPIALFYKYYSTDTYQQNNFTIHTTNYPLYQSTLKFSIHCLFDYFSQFSSPKTKILKILQKKNICHKSSDDNPALYICC